MPGELVPQVFVAANAGKLFRDVLIMAVVMSTVASQLVSLVAKGYREILSGDLLTLLGVWYLARLVSSCHASLVVVRGSEFEIFDVMGKKMGPFPSSHVTIGPSKRVKGGFRVPLVYDGWAKVEMLLSAGDEGRLRELAPRYEHQAPKIPYILLALAVPLTLIANVSLAIDAVRATNGGPIPENVTAVLSLNGVFLVAIAWLRLRGKVGLRAIVRRLL